MRNQYVFTGNVALGGWAYGIDDARDPFYDYANSGRSGRGGALDGGHSNNSGQGVTIFASKCAARSP